MTSRQQRREQRLEEAVALIAQADAFLASTRPLAEEELRPTTVESVIASLQHIERKCEEAKALYARLWAAWVEYYEDLRSLHTEEPRTNRYGEEVRPDRVEVLKALEQEAKYVWANLSLQRGWDRMAADEVHAAVDLIEREANVLGLAKELHAQAGALALVAGREVDGWPGYARIGSALAMLRTVSTVTQDKLALRLGISKAMISHLESHRRERRIPVETLFQWVDECGRKVRWQWVRPDAQKSAEKEEVDDIVEQVRAMSPDQINLVRRVLEGAARETRTADLFSRIVALTDEERRLVDVVILGLEAKRGQQTGGS